jgi:hypothetical protein
MKLTNPLTSDKVYRVTIYSKDVISGNIRDGVYQIDLPDMIPDIGKYHIAVEEALIYTASVDGGTGGNSRTYVFETSTTVPNSYSTSSKTGSRVLFMAYRTSSSNAPNAYYKPITSRTIGIPVSDLSLLRNKQMRISIKTALDELQSEANFPLATSGWCMTLVVYPFNDS